MKKIAVLLAGCGSKDGSEIQESVLALAALSKAGLEAHCFALKAPQFEVVDHTNDEVASNASRNQITEAARIARGNITPLEELNTQNFDGLLIPGGFGTAKNFFSFAQDGMDFKVEENYKRVVTDFHASQKPVAVMCIAPLSLCAIIEGVTITLGERGELALNAEATFGAKVIEAKVDEVVVDAKNKAVTVPSYMYGDATVAQIASGADNLITELLKFL